MQQFSLPLPPPPAQYHREQFVVSACNALALRQLEQWPDGLSSPGALLLHGPEGSGKTHLAHIWAQRLGAHFLPPQMLDAGALPPGALVVDGLEQLCDETALFHLFNRCRDEARPLLLVSRRPAAKLDFLLPDLNSRLRATPQAQVEAPDDEALAAVLRKQFSDRQLKVGQEVIDYMLARMPRSFGAARQWVERLDREALAQKKPIGMALARALLAQAGEG